MIRKSRFFTLVTWAAVSGTLLHAQERSARDRLTAAHGLYYTPTTSGLKSFHCAATIDWKGMLTRISGQDVPDDNPMLKYLNSIQLSVSDDLRGKGELEWTEVGPPPAGREDSLKQTLEGFQRAVTGFFQVWNSYVNGGMVPLPDNSVIVTSSDQGVHLSGTATQAKIDEDFDKNMLLEQTLVESTEMRVQMQPTYTSTPDGLLVSNVKSQIHQPPTAAVQESDFEVEYAKVEAFQLPSHVVLDIKNTGVLDFRLNACQVSLSEWAQKPAIGSPR